MESLETPNLITVVSITTVNLSEDGAGSKKTRPFTYSSRDQDPEILLLFFFYFQCNLDRDQIVFIEIGQIVKISNFS